MPEVLRLLLQVAVIATSARVLGSLFLKIGQPRVMGEMVAGILLGPTLFGWAWPQGSEALFPADGLGSLNMLSQIGLLLFMFLIGLEFNEKLLRGLGHVAVMTSHVSIVVPYLLGALLALYLYPELSDERVGFTEFALFMGAAMSVTAFPVLAHILRERKINRTELGTIAIACAAVDDVTAWCLLAYIVAFVRASHGATPMWLTLSGLTLYILFMVFAARPLLARLVAGLRHRRARSEDMTAIVLVLLLISAMTTEWLGVHLLFGAFLFGAVMPKEGRFVAHLTDRIESVTLVLFLPIFFAYTGLRTSIGLLSNKEMWWLCGLVLVVAIVGKLGGSAVAARVAGMEWRDATAVGVLMNTRGLMELVILNIGLSLEIISPALFSMMVVMTLVTTFMTTPILELIRPSRTLRSSHAAPAGEYAYSDRY